MSDKQAEEENVYKKYSIRSEHVFSLTAHTNVYKSRLWIEGKLWEFTYESATKYSNEKLELQMKKNSSAGDNKTAAEIILWYWDVTKEIVIFHQKVYDDFSILLNEDGYSYSRINKKLNLVIRLLDKRNEDGNNGLLESYYGDFGMSGIPMATLRVVGNNGETEASFTVPKLDLMRASPVFQRMFTAEMTEKATGEVKIEDTNAEEFGDFLKAISPKQEHPNPSNVLALLKLADPYECQLLRNRCEAHLMNCIEISLVERIKCANFYGLKNLKENLLMQFEGTGILESYRDTKPHRDLHQALDELIG